MTIEVPRHQWLPGAARVAWTDEAIEAVKALIKDGLSARRVALRLNKQVPGITRNAVIGKMHRLAHRGGGGPNNNQGVKRSPAPRIPREPKIKLKPKVRPKMDEDFHLKDMRLITIVELTENTCHWPVGDPKEDDFRYCGLPKLVDGGPYCRHHFAKSLRCNEVEARP